jgi:hypothetical protein
MQEIHLLKQTIAHLMSGENHLNPDQHAEQTTHLPTSTPTTVTAPAPSTPPQTTSYPTTSHPTPTTPDKTYADCLKQSKSDKIAEKNT